MQNSFYNERICPENKKWEQANKREIQLYGRNNEIRSDFERDYTRILHSQAYRRLKHKTQVFFAPHNDHICTRMEHVMHVASVATTIAKYLGLNELVILFPYYYFTFGETSSSLSGSNIADRLSFWDIIIIHKSI